MDRIRVSIYSLWDKVYDFAWCLRRGNASYSDKVEQWKSIARVSSETLRQFEELILQCKEWTGCNGW